jgi:hypothetical protein
MHFEEILETIGAAASAFRDLLRNVDERRKDVSVAVCQDRRGFDVVHFGNLVVKLDKVDGWVARRDCVEAVFD